MSSNSDYLWTSEEDAAATSSTLPLADGAKLLRGFALQEVPTLMNLVNEMAERAPFRHMATPGGRPMSVAMTNCGELGWISDRRGYRYDPVDPTTDQPWPAMPESFQHLARRAATEAGFPGFAPDACLINRYKPGARMSLHQDKDERDFSQPIVSVSLGLPAVFLFGGFERSEKPQKIRIESGDIVVWGGPARLTFHGIEPLEDGIDPVTGNYRFNLTFRRAL